MALIVHIDFKGLPLSPDYLCARFAELRDAGATGVLLEWEDMLPFCGELAPLACPHAYGVGEVAQIVQGAVALGLDTLHVEPRGESDANDAAAGQPGPAGLLVRRVNRTARDGRVDDRPSRFPRAGRHTQSDRPPHLAAAIGARRAARADQPRQARDLVLATEVPATPR